MTIFYLIRHAQIDRHANSTNPPLSIQGRAEARQVALCLQSRPIVHIYASPLRRAEETAAYVATTFGLPVIVEPRLRERMNFGDLPGQSFAQFVALWERCSRERDYLPPVGDSSQGAGQRVEAFMAAVHAALVHVGVRDGEVVAIAHGGLIADFLLNVCPPATLALLSPAFAAQPYASEIMRNGAITVVEYRAESNGARRYVVREIASTGHLPD